MGAQAIAKNCAIVLRNMATRRCARWDAVLVGFAIEQSVSEMVSNPTVRPGESN